MAIVLYSNGLTEDYRPQNLVFTEEELVYLFSEYTEIKTVRTPSVINTWAIFGTGNDEIEDFNRIASEITDERVFTHVLFVHDSELNPDWNLTDDIIYNDYSRFLKTMKNVIEEVSRMIMNEMVKTDTEHEKKDVLPQLITLGVTKDESKRVLFAFNPEDQKQEFYNNEEFTKFSKKVYEYLTEHKQIEDPFTIYADKKAVIIIESANVQLFLDSLLENFKSTEEYEICTKITKMKSDWMNNHTEKSESSGDNANESN